MRLDPARVAETKSWLDRAKTDLRAADHDATADPPITADIAFHAQQTVEKSLKAFLSWNDEPYRKTHNLVELGEQCAALDSSLEPLLRRATVLTEYAWKYRYPGEAQEPDIVEAAAATALARDVFEAVLERIPEEARP
jgi:HEPN domain-containing protein